MRISELSEFGLIDLLASMVSKQGRHEPRLVLGIGDDAAAWRTDAGLALATTDALVEDAHFNADTVSWRDLGWKTLAVNFSDIAAMGGVPEYALVTLCLPLHREVEEVTDLYQGMIEAANEFHVSIVGGDMTVGKKVAICATVLGKAGESVLSRSAAMPGDMIAVSGYLGQAAGGLRMLDSSCQADPDVGTFLREAFFRPRPRVVEGQLLATHGAKAAIDLSDGLLSDLFRICQASGVGAEVWVHRLPIHPSIRMAFAGDALYLALCGGEDYELLFTSPGEVMNKVEAMMPCLITVIGQMVEGAPLVTLLDERGETVEWSEMGWDHFRKA
ncbi:thiamine-phosphate kinase [Chloroflexota bacterium]